MKIIPNKIKSFFKKESMVQSLLTIQAPGGVVWKERDYENFAKEAYMANVIAYRCIIERASAVASVPFVEYTGDDPSTNQPEWLTRPNPNDSFSFLLLQLMSFYYLAGNSYLERVSPLTGGNAGTIKELYVQRPDRVKIIIDVHTGSKSGYIYTLGGRTKTWEVDPITMQSDLLQLKTFHPTNDFYGLAITEPAAKEIDTFNEATKMNKNLLQNQGRPGLVASIILDPDKGFTQLTDKQFDLLEKQLKEKYSGGGVGSSLILQGTRGTKVEPYGFNPQELDFLEGGRETARRICTAFRVPPQIIGIPGENKFANYAEARLAFWEDTIIPDVNFVKGELNNWVYESGAKEHIKPVLDDIAALAPRRQKLWERAQNSDFLTINEKREMVGKSKYGNEGDVIYIGANLLPLGFEGESTEDQEKAIKADLSKQGFSDDEITKMLY